MHVLSVRAVGRAQQVSEQRPPCVCSGAQRWGSGARAGSRRASGGPEKWQHSGGNHEEDPACRGSFSGEETLTSPQLVQMTWSLFTWCFGMPRTKSKLIEGSKTEAK